MRVFYYRPQCAVADTRIVMAMHGLDRGAAAFRDLFVAAAELHGQLILAPEFDIEAFADPFAYNYGNVRQAPPGNVFRPRDQWTFDLIDRLFQQVRTMTASQRTTFSLFGNSAGAQYVLRYLALTGGRLVDAAVAANSGWYMLPDPAIEYPAGLANPYLDREAVSRYLGRSVTLLLGDKDIDTTAHDLPRRPEAMAQGIHRLERGHWYYRHCRELAERLGVAFNWQFEIAHGAGHIDQLIFDQGVEILAKTFKV